MVSLVITDNDLLKFSGSVFALEFVLLCIYSFAVGVQRKLVMESTTDELYSYVCCSNGSPQFESIMGLLILGYNSVLVLCGCLVAFLTRRVDSAYNESRHIAFSMYDMLVCIVILVPIYYTTGDGVGSATRKYLLRSLAMLFANTFTMLAMFAPKLWALREYNRASECDSLDYVSPRITELKASVRMPPGFQPEIASDAFLSAPLRLASKGLTNDMV